MSKRNNLDEPAVFFIPENFIATGTLLGGMVKVRNAVEAIIAMVVVGYPIYLIPMNFTVKIAIMCILCLPVGILALVGLNNGPLSEFLLDVFKYFRLTRKYKYQEKTVNNENIDKKGGEKHEQKQ